ncbi:carbonate dehydratase [Xylogone sp. PMI_703]|nr:carbonate dehydratase [Xylogone sp. PMI_703]
MGSAQDIFEYALSSNAAWAGYKSHQNPSYFPKLAAGQSPTILWLGCSDSRVPETTVLGLQPGDVFVHRNIANIISPTDINSSSVIEYAVSHLHVQHIFLCGHTCCGGAAAALSDSRVGGVLDTWLAPLKGIRRAHEQELKQLGEHEHGDGEKARRLAELNVEAGVKVLLSNHVVEEAVEKRGLQVHGVLFDLASGRLRDLGVGNAKSRANAQIAKEGDVVRGNHGMLVFGENGASMTVR